MADKYVIIKKEHFDRWVGVHEVPVDDTILIRDGVVIRRQDVFAPPALDAYANAILTALQLDSMSTTEPNPRATQLGEIADYFHEQAELAWHTDRKLPD